MTPFAVEIRYDAEFSPSFFVTAEAVQTASEVHALERFPIWPTPYLLAADCQIRRPPLDLAIQREHGSKRKRKPL